MDAFGIFEGGGAKGLAHVGALFAAEQRGIKFLGVAGASAGAILASLISAGYSAEELFSPSNPNDLKNVYSVDFLSFFKERWPEFKSATEDFDKLTSTKNAISAWFKLGWLGFKHRKIISTLRKDHGVFDTLVFEQYLDQKLEEKLIKLHPEITTEFPELKTPRTKDCVRICFHHIKMPLKIVATDTTRGQLLVFSQQESKTYQVAKAVAASICLPFVFKPKQIDLSTVNKNSQQSGVVQAIDGGLLSNFPAWLFDEERTKVGPHVPTFGFRLVESQDSSNSALNANHLAAFTKQLTKTVLNGDPLLETREIENLHEIPLNVTTGTLDFHMNSAQKKTLFDQGYDSASKHFDQPGLPRDPILISEALGQLIKSFKTLFDISEDVLIRANVICQTTRKTLRVTYSYGMDTSLDTDDQLEFRIGGGACSRCWTKRYIVYCDLETAAHEFESEWKMSKYQQALVRKDLKCLLCYPILIKDELGNENIIGVLNLDSPHEILKAIFRSEELDDFMQPVTAKLATLMLSSMH